VGVSGSTSCDTTKAAKWHGLETQSSDRLAPSWLAEKYSHAQRKISRGVCAQGLSAEGHFLIS